MELRRLEGGGWNTREAKEQPIFTLEPTCCPEFGRTAGFYMQLRDFFEGIGLRRVGKRRILRENTEKGDFTPKFTMQEGF